MTIPRLFIDTLHLTLPVPSEMRALVLERMNDASEHWLDHLTSLVSRGRYRDRYQLRTENGEIITILARPRRNSGNLLKLEYSPEKIGLGGSGMLGAYLLFILGPDFRDIFYNGNVIRLDATFDIRGIAFRDLWIYETHDDAKKSAIIRGHDLEQETQYNGYKESRQLIVYDKRKEQQQLHARRSRKAWIRFEYRYSKGDYRLNEVSSRLRNPYKNFRVRRYKSNTESIAPYYSRLLFDACILRGAENTIASTPEAHRPTIEAAIAEFPHAFFWRNRNSIWRQLGSRIAELIPAHTPILGNT